MSMILDALRKADSERERGAVPGLHAQPVSPPSIDAAPPARARPWHWIAIGVLAVLLVSLAGYFVGREVQPPAANAAIEKPPVAAALPSPPAVLPPESSKPEPVAQAAPWPAPETRSAPANPQPAPDAAPAEAVVYAREQLPDSVRAALPPLTFGGSMYSSNPVNRSLVVNGGLYRENDQVAADLVLEQIKPKAAVFRFRGYRFEMPF